MNNALRIATFGALAASLLGSAVAQEEFAGKDLPACYPDMATHCQGVRRGGGRLVKCVQEHLAAVSAECKAALTPSDFANPSEGVSITVTLTNLKAKTGSVIVALTDDPGSFPQGRRTIVVPVTGDAMAVTFRHLKPNTYAVTAFHDENDNGQYEVFVEGIGVSNGAVGMPDFEASKFKVNGDTSISVAMAYL